MTDTHDGDTPKLHIDSDWKAEAQAEKERLAAAEAKAGASGGAESGQMPEADMRSLIGVLASQALMGLGTMQDPDTKGIVVDLEGSRFAIDLLGVVEEKTRGNLDADEAKEIKQVLDELRARFVQLSQFVAQQAAAGKVTTGERPGPAAPGLEIP